MWTNTRPLLLVLVVPLLASASTPPPLTPAEAVLVQLQVFLTEASGGTSERASAHVTVRPHDRGLAYYVSSSGCDGTAVGFGDPDPSLLVKPDLVFRVEVEIIGADTESTTFDVSWAREWVSTGGRMSRVEEKAQRVTLKHGVRRTLDFARDSGAPGLCGDASLRFDVSTRVSEDPQFQAAEIAYDLWVVDQSPRDPAPPRRLTLTGRQGEPVKFAFDALRWPLAATFDDGARAEVAAFIEGTLEGRRRADGSIALLLNASRMNSVIRAGSRLSYGGIGDGGQKRLVMRPGETIALVLPPAQGVARQWKGTDRAELVTGDAAPDANTVTETDRSISVDFRRFFAGHTISVRMTARPL